MAFYPKAENGGYKLKKSRKDETCLICREKSPKGTERYVGNQYIPGFCLCKKCYSCWTDEGGMLGLISRKK